MFWHQQRTIAVAFLALLAALICAAPTSVIAGEERPFVFMDEPIPPYTLGKEGEICEEGLTKEIFDELFGRLGLQYEIRLVPWARAMDRVSHGECDGIPLLMKNAERTVFLDYTDPVVENRESLYYLPKRMGDFQWKTFFDLTDYNIGMVRGYTYSEHFLAAIKTHNIQITYAKDSRMNFRMLQAGRVDMIIEDETVIKPFLDENPDWADQTASAAKPVSTYHWYIGLSRLSPLVKYIPAINHTLGTMREDGTLKRILDKR